MCNASNALDFARIDEVQGLHLFHNRAEELDFSPSIGCCASLFDLEERKLVDQTSNAKQ
jgi:hypothetical protein